jgi:hypothetical protein
MRIWRSSTYEDGNAHAFVEGKESLVLEDGGEAVPHAAVACSVDGALAREGLHAQPRAHEVERVGRHRGHHTGHSSGDDSDQRRHGLAGLRDELERWPSARNSGTG